MAIPDSARASAIVFLFILSLIIHVKSFQLGSNFNFAQRPAPFTATIREHAVHSTFGKKPASSPSVHVSLYGILVPRMMDAATTNIVDPFDKVRDLMPLESKLLLVDNVDPGTVSAIDLVSQKERMILTRGRRLLESESFVLVACAEL